MTKNASGPPDGEGRAALALMEQALEALDRWGGGNDAGAHLDLAICRLRGLVGLEPTGPFDADPRTCQQLGPDELPWSKA